MTKLQTALALAGLAALTVMAHDAFAAPAWDGSFTRVKTVVMDAGQVIAPVTASTGRAQTYVKANCTADTRIGPAYSDGGTLAGPYACFLSDAGTPCDLYRFSVGEKFYCQLAPGMNAVVFQGAAGTCDVYEGR